MSFFVNEHVAFLWLLKVCVWVGCPMTLENAANEPFCGSLSTHRLHQGVLGSDFNLTDLLIYYVLQILHNYLLNIVAIAHFIFMTLERNLPCLFYE